MIKEIEKETRLQLAETGGLSYGYMVTTTKFILEPGTEEAIKWLQALPEAPETIWEGQGPRVIVDYMWKKSYGAAVLHSSLNILVAVPVSIFAV